MINNNYINNKQKYCKGELNKEIGLWLILNKISDWYWSHVHSFIFNTSKSWKFLLLSSYAKLVSLHLFILLSHIHLIFDLFNYRLDQFLFYFIIIFLTVWLIPLFSSHFRISFIPSCINHWVSVVEVAKKSSGTLSVK